MATTNPKTSHIFSRHVAPFAPLALALLMHSASPSHRRGTPPPPPPAASTDGGGGFSQTCTNPHFPPNSAPTAMDQTSCTILGNGGAEAAQNQAKNNFCAIGQAKVMTIPDLVSLQAKVQQDPTIPFGNSHNHPLTAKSGPATDRTPLQALGEGTVVTLQGFVLIARQEGAESVNCGQNVSNDPVNHDIHISIVESPDQPECSGVVVEMIPHHRPASWNPQNLMKVASAKLPVRITGQLMFDSSHTPCQNGTSIQGDPKRVSLWEAHPVYGFDVCPQGTCSSGNGWVSLEEFAKQ
jgi:hypothetical protein